MEDTPPTVSSTLPDTGATGVAVDANITVTFSEPVNLGTGWYSITCGTSGTHTAEVDETADPIIVIDPHGTFTRGESCEVILEADNILDEDGTLHNLAADYPWTFTVTSVEPAPTVFDVTPAVNAVNVPLSSDITVKFSEPVKVADGWYGITCGTTNHTAFISGGPTDFILNPDVDFNPGTSCTVAIDPSKVNDQDTDDPDDLMVAGYSWSFTTTSCGAAFTPIYTIQGSGETGMSGAVTTQGVVVSDNEGAQPALRGFYLQDLTGDGDPDTSDGIFVFNNTNNSVALGDVVRVSGTASEYQGQTQISLNSTLPVVEKCGTGSVSPVDVILPFASATDAEKYEGMLVRFPQTLYVTEHFQLGRFGQVVLSSDAKLAQPTNIYTPGTDAQALQAANNLNRIILDDSTNKENPDPIIFGRGGLPLSAANTLRGGDTITGMVGVMTYTWAGNSASGNAYRVRPVDALGIGMPAFQPVNPRPTTAPAVGGRLTVTTMNLLNYFNTFTNCTLGVGGAASTSNCRGASNQTEFDRQWPKTVQGILKTNAAVIGLAELENDGYGPTSAIQDLVNHLNTATAPGTYALIDVDTLTGQVNALGTDAIKVGLIYKPAVVTPVGTTAALNTEAFVNGGDTTARNRPALAQAFQENISGGRFVITVNHLKSKGSACDIPDAGDGQGNCNVVRTNAANLLHAWLAADPTGTGETDILIMGDLNSYAMEDPITAIKSAGYTDLLKLYGGDEAYSYVFDGQWGYLDHALAYSSILPQVTVVAEYHINSDEPSVLDYLTDFKSAGQIISLYNADEYRISDHDPIMIGLNLDTVPVTTMWVNDDWAALSNGALVPAGGGTHVIGYDAFATLQAGIAAAPAGGTVNVLDGTYNETGQIVISKNLTINGESAAGTLIKPTANTGDSGDAGSWILVDNDVTLNLSKVTLDGAGQDIRQGIRFNGSGVVDDVVIQNMVYPGYFGWAIAQGYTNTNPRTLTVTNSTFTNFGRVGIQTDNGSGTSTVTITDNTFTCRGAGDNLNYGIYVEGGANAIITGNTITGCLGVVGIWDSAAIAVGTYFAPGTTANITDNILTNSTTGIAVGYDATDTSTVTAEMNQITGNTYAISTTAPLVDGSPNWFGSAAGPATGTIDGRVTFTPWCAQPECTSFLPTGAGYYEIPAGTNGADVQAILNNVPEGSTIKFLGSTGSLSGGYIINIPNLTIILADGTVIQNNSPCFVVNADNTIIKAETIGGAQCVPTSTSNGIDVNGVRTNLTIEGIEFVGTAGTDGIHFGTSGTDVITNLVIIDNYIHNFSGAGLFFAAQPAGVIDIRGNMFKNNTGNGIEAGALVIPAEYNAWGNIAGATAGDGASAGVDAEPWTHVDVYVTSSGTPWANQVVKGQSITYTVYGNLHEAFGADISLAYPANLTLDSTALGGTFDNLSVIDTTTPGIIKFHGIASGYAAQSGTAMPIFSATFTGTTAGAALPMNLDETTDGFAMNPGTGSSTNIYADAVVDATVTIIDLPTLTSTDLPGYYLTGDPQEFHVTLTNPASGGSFSNVLFNFRIAGASTSDLSLEYYEVMTSTWQTLPLTPSGADLVGTYGPPAGFPIIPGYTATSAFRVTASTAKNYPVTITLNDLVSTPANAELARLEQTAVVYTKPVITSTDLIGPYLVGSAQNFTLNITNASPIPPTFDLVLTFPAGTTIVYGGTTYTCDATGCTIPVSLPAASNDLTFSVTFAAAYNGPVTANLYDSDLTPDRLLATFTQAGVVAYDVFGLTGTFSMQGRSTRLGIPVTLTGTAYTYNATSIEAITANVSFASVAAITYTITTNQPRYLNVTADLLRQKTVSTAGQVITPLELRGGNAVWQDWDAVNSVWLPSTIINLADASQVGTDYGQLSSTFDGDVNFSSKVDIFDLALVGGNYGLTSAAAYGTWVP